MQKKIKDVTVGDRLDLDGDAYATSNDPTPEFEFCVVSGVEIETPYCIRVDFENYVSVGFPNEHMVTIDQ